MRKKYLSALLFGALLFASAGTFTSCKDYDDDIDNLSQRIDQVASDLNDLQTKVDALGGMVSDVTFADGTLTVKTDKGDFTCNIPDKTGVQKVELSKDGNNLVLTVDGVAQEPIALPEQQEVPEIKVEGGKLIVGDKSYDLAVDVQSNVTAVKNNIDGTYTLTVNGETVTLPLAYAEVRIDFVSTPKFTEMIDAEPANSGKVEEGIHWATATSAISWDGPKGAIAAGQLLVGQISAVQVSVRPVSYDLSDPSHTLKLVDSKGNYAPVIVKATKGVEDGPIHAESRADANVNVGTLQQGEYALTIQMDETVTKDNIITAFANDVPQNIKYALEVDGVKVTDYDVVIDTQLRADAQLQAEKFDWNKFVVGGKGTVYDETTSLKVTSNAIELDEDDYYIAVPCGTNVMSYMSGAIYDMKVEIDPSSEDDAELKGVEVKDGNVLVAPEAAYGRSYKLKVTLIDVNGNQKSEVVRVKITDQINTVTQLTTIQYKVTPDLPAIKINLQDVFSSLTAAQAVAIYDAENVQWSLEDKSEDKFLVSSTFLERMDADEDVVYYEDEACTKPVSLSDGVTAEKVRKIHYALINYEASDLQTNATPEEFLLTLTISNEFVEGSNQQATEVIKKINVPVNVVLPTWDEVFKTTNQWTNNTFNTRLTSVDVTSKVAKISMDAFEDASTAWGGNINDGIKITKLKYTDNAGREQNANGTALPNAGVGESNGLITLDYAALTENTATTGKLTFTDMTAKAEYAIGGKENLTIEKEFSVKLKSIFEDAKLVYYGSDKKAAAQAKMNAANEILKGDIATDGMTVNGEGLVLELNGYKTVASTDLIGTAGKKLKTEDNSITGNEFTISNNSTSTVNAIQVWKTEAQANGLNNGNLTTGTNKNIKVTGSGTIEIGTSGTVTLYFKDAMGVQTEAPIKFTKE
ncbi:hypothetical protein [Phocaeicola salanitronis]|uniref:hypothetical protein n=1 Tax=Phocaeicola salanitronis TaxID=376805 RepID=UPI0023FA113D|nr:hypothetical protein [Phocaeicola salanitronis]